MGPHYVNIESDTLDNDMFRRILYTVPGKLQLVLMSVNDEIPEEVHSDTVQFIRIESGHGLAILGGPLNQKRYPLFDGITLTIPPGTTHRIVNTGKEPLKLYTIYSTDEHKENKQ